MNIDLVTVSQCVTMMIVSVIPEREERVLAQNSFNFPPVISSSTF